MIWTAISLNWLQITTCQTSHMTHIGQFSLYHISAFGDGGGLGKKKEKVKEFYQKNWENIPFLELRLVFREHWKTYIYFSWNNGWFSKEKVARPLLSMGSFVILKTKFRKVLGNGTNLWEKTHISFSWNHQFTRPFSSKMAKTFGWFWSFILNIW